MGTLVLLHAHPDDEASSTAGTAARAVAEGHRVVLVVATDGAYGEVPGDLGEGETLVDRRRAETARSADVLGIARVAWLGYRDSGMTGWVQNADPLSFHMAPLDEAAERLAAILRDERADVLTAYDWHGVYGHPDHIKVHTVGHRAAQLAGTAKVFDATMNRTLMGAMLRQANESGLADLGDNFDPDGPADDGNPFGSPESEISLHVDVSAYIELKRESIRCHASQVSDTTMFLGMSPEVFAMAFGAEWFIDRDAPGRLREGFVIS